MPHNLVVGKEGALETVGLAADKMVALPDAFAKNFVPADAGGAVLDPAAQSRRDRAGALHRAYAAGELPVHLHVPGPLADDERHHRGAAGGQPRSPSHDASRLPAARDGRRVPGRPGARRHGAVIRGRRAARRLRHRRRRVSVRDLDADDRGDPREAARPAHVGRLRAGRRRRRRTTSRGSRRSTPPT